MQISLRDIKIELSRREFWEYCKTTEPEFYRESRPHLRRLCNTLDDFYHGRLLMDNGDPFVKLMIRLPPQHGKSRTLVNFTKWCLGKNRKERIITGSYGDAPASDFARYTRDGIMEIANTTDQIVYSDIFPGTKIKQGNASVQKWALEGEHFNYLGVGYGGGVTGKGATLRIIDDLVKDAEVALSDTALDKIWRWLSGTFSSRNSAEGGEVKEIFCATLWGDNDPQSILEKTEGSEWYILSMPIYDEVKDEMLCDELMNKKAFTKLKNRMLVDPRTKLIFYANYMCEAIIDEEMVLFPQNRIARFKELNKQVEDCPVFAYIDTADSGEDSLSMPVVKVINKKAYLIDVIFTKENLTVTEDQIVAKCKELGIDHLFVENNKEGTLFVNNLRKRLNISVYGIRNSTKKTERIWAQSGFIMENFVFKEEFEPLSEYGKFMKELTGYLKTGKVKFDDSPDSIAGLSKILRSRFYYLFDEEE